MEAALKAIAGPRRRQILTLVRDGELSAGEIAGHFDVTRPAVSQHLNVLKEAGLVSERRNGTRRLYRARPEGLAELKEFLEEFWDERLSALKREAEKEEKKRGNDDRDDGRAGARDRREPRDGLGVPRRPGEAGALVREPGLARPAPRRAVPRRRDPGAYRERRVRRARSAAAPRSHLRLGVRGRPGKSGAGGHEHDRVRARAERRGDDSQVSSLRPAERGGCAESRPRLGSLPRTAGHRGARGRPRPGPRPGGHVSVVGHDEWLEARRELLAKEKEFTHARDQLTRQRQALPWEAVEKDYVFDGPNGEETLAELFD